MDREEWGDQVGLVDLAALVVLEDLVDLAA